MAGHFDTTPPECEKGVGGLKIELVVWLERMIVIVHANLL